MARAWRYIAAGLAAFGVAGRAGHTIYFEHFSGPEPAHPRERTDAEAIGGDWRAVGNDLRSAMDEVREEEAFAEAEPAG